MKFALEQLKWTREPDRYVIRDGKIEITTQPGTDLWQRTYYHFRNDNAPVLQLETEEKFFSFVVKTEFSGAHHRFDQCGVVMYLNSENWLKGSVEYENETFQHLGSVAFYQAAQGCRPVGDTLFAFVWLFVFGLRLSLRFSYILPSRAVRHIHPGAVVVSYPGASR